LSSKNVSQLSREIDESNLFQILEQTKKCSIQMEEKNNLQQNHFPDLHPREIQNKLIPKPKTYRAHEHGGGHIFVFLEWLGEVLRCLSSGSRPWGRAGAMVAGVLATGP
jgi:hypothetical protein